MLLLAAYKKENPLPSGSGFDRILLPVD